ncbi:MAG: L-cysteine:1D-myo-inositol 2-amino-2-deoxy-alpha-D-glucopyranoside ligase, partial [Pseudonocardiales bacterium]|nr:L-cysteine:1D-myo-inositol 2-amino-2-deoxy-alpha-D-glucopyranoside ligase [Pseudonocardiales bacterium]
RELLTEVRARLADDLDTIGAMAAVDRWVSAASLDGGTDELAPALVRDLVDALFGIEL